MLSKQLFPYLYQLRKCFIIVLDELAVDTFVTQ